MSVARRRAARMARALAGGLGALLALATAALAHGAEAERIRGIMRATFDRPEAPLLVEPIVVVGDHAVAGWRQGDLGGRAVLRRAHGEWEIFLCGGDALKSARELQRAGIPEADARAIARELATAEARLPPDAVAALGTLKVVIPVGSPSPAPGGPSHDHGGGTSHDHGGHGAHPPAREPSR